ncbi:hypothetical protein BsWGS_25680 [Bradybaena similaris]
MVPLVLLLLLFLREGSCQDDYSGQVTAENDVTFLNLPSTGKERTAVGGFEGKIECYTCEGTAENSTCSDPFDVSGIGIKVCERGICLKWTKYRGGVLQMIRTCSADVDFHLTMIDGVCRTERNGNGYLCMCGKRLCNSVPAQNDIFQQRTIVFTVLFITYSLRIFHTFWPT